MSRNTSFLCFTFHSLWKKVFHSGGKCICICGDSLISSEHGSVSGHLSTFHLSVIATFTFSTSTFRLCEIPSIKVNVALNKEKSCRFYELSKSHARWSSWKDWFRTNQIKEREKSESEKVKIKIIADLQLMPSWNRNLPGLRQLICLSGCFRWQQMWISELSAFDISVFFCIIVNNKLLQLEMFHSRLYQSG